MYKITENIIDRAYVSNVSVVLFIIRETFVSGTDIYVVYDATIIASVSLFLANGTRHSRYRKSLLETGSLTLREN